MAAFLVIVLVTLQAGMTNASPIPLSKVGTLRSLICPAAAPATTIGLLPADRVVTGNESSFPAFNSSDYPEHNFTGHDGYHHHSYHHNHSHCEHGNTTDNVALLGLGAERHHETNSTPHRMNETECTDEGPHDYGKAEMNETGHSPEATPIPELATSAGELRARSDLGVQAVLEEGMASPQSEDDDGRSSWQLRLDDSERVRHKEREQSRCFTVAGGRVCGQTFWGDVGDDVPEHIRSLD